MPNKTEFHFNFIYIFLSKTSNSIRSLIHSHKHQPHLLVCFLGHVIISVFTLQEDTARIIDHSDREWNTLDHQQLVSRNEEGPVQGHYMYVDGKSVFTNAISSNQKSKLTGLSKGWAVKFLLAKMLINSQLRCQWSAHRVSIEYQRSGVSINT